MGDRWNIWCRGSLVNDICSDSHVHHVVTFVVTVMYIM